MPHPQQQDAPRHAERKQDKQTATKDEIVEQSGKKGEPLPQIFSVHSRLRRFFSPISPENMRRRRRVGQHGKQKRGGTTEDIKKNGPPSFFLQQNNRKSHSDQHKEDQVKILGQESKVGYDHQREQEAQKRFFSEFRPLLRQLERLFYLQVCTGKYKDRQPEIHPEEDQGRDRHRIQPNQRQNEEAHHKRPSQRLQKAFHQQETKHHGNQVRENPRPLAEPSRKEITDRMKEEIIERRMHIP